MAASEYYTLYSFRMLSADLTINFHVFLAIISHENKTLARKKPQEKPDRAQFVASGNTSAGNEITQTLLEILEKDIHLSEDRCS